jgi:WD40 repeat protein
MMVSVAYSPDGGILATGSQDKTAMQWRPSGPAAFTRRGPPLTKVATVAFRRDGRALAAGGTVGAISLWDLSDPARPVKRGSPLAGVGARLSQDGRTLAVRGKDDAVTLWDVSDPARAVRRGPPLTGAGVPATFSRNGRLLITADKDQAMLWDLSDPARPVRRGSAFKGMGYSGLLAAFSSDGRTLVIGNFFDFDHKVSLWDVSDPRRPTDRRTPVKAGETAFVASVEFSPDSRILATGRGDGTTVLWDLADPKRPVRLSQPLAGPHAAAGTGVSVLTSTTAIVALAFSADQRTLAVTSQDKSLTLWDLTDASTPRKLGGPPAGLSAAAFSVAFSPDGRALATGGSDGTLTVWDLSGVNDLRAHAAARACAITTRGLDRAEWAHYVTGLPYQRTCA